jgi:hypothetical protein
LGGKWGVDVLGGGAGARRERGASGARDPNTERAMKKGRNWMEGGDATGARGLRDARDGRAMRARKWEAGGRGRAGGKVGDEGKQSGKRAMRGAQFAARQ